MFIGPCFPTALRCLQAAAPALASALPGTAAKQGEDEIEDSSGGGVPTSIKFLMALGDVDSRGAMLVRVGVACVSHSNACGWSGLVW